MPTLVFERTGYTAEVPEGGAVVDVCDEHPRAGVPFSCRGANCGTCRVHVTEGLEHCEPAGPDERELLALLGDRPGHRLACQLRVRPGPGVVRLRVTL
jgi:ferredoxin